MRVICILCVVVPFLIGCGQTAQERYNTALSIQEREAKLLAEMEPGRDEADKLAISKACRDITGNALQIESAPSTWSAEREAAEAKFWET